MLEWVCLVWLVGLRFLGFYLVAWFIGFWFWFLNSLLFGNFIVGFILAYKNENNTTGFNYKAFEIT